MNNNMTIAREEIFGPVLATIALMMLKKLIRQANDNPYGLAAAIWTRDVAKAHRVARRLQAGTVWVNTYNNYDPAALLAAIKRVGMAANWARPRLNTTRN